MNENANSALVPRPPSAIDKPETGARRVLSCMVEDTLAMAKKEPSSEACIRRIVVVDDEPMILELVETLALANFRNVTVQAFQDGEQAWQELLRADPDLLITDMCRPPGMSGWEMLPLLAQRKVKYPVLVMSGIAKEKDVRQCTGPNLDVTFWTKPFPLERLTQYLFDRLGTTRIAGHE